MAMGFEMKAKATKLRVRGEPNGNVWISNTTWWEWGAKSSMRWNNSLNLLEIGHTWFASSQRPESCNHNITSFVVIKCAMPSWPHHER
jgi:hypothetical protein